MINFSKLSLVKDLYYSLDKDIVKVVDSYHDPIITKKILSNVYAWNEEDNIHLNTLLKGTDHHRDFRDNRGYAFNIILNWLVEDLIYEVLLNDFSIQKVGSDNKRELLQGSRVTSEPDLLINENPKIWIEVIANYPINNFSSFWEKEFYFDLRDNKFKSLLGKSLEDKVIVLGVVVKKKSFFIKTISEKQEFRSIKKEANFGYKSTTRIYFEDNKINLIESKKLVDTIRNLIG